GRAGGKAALRGQRLRRVAAPPPHEEWGRGQEGEWRSVQYLAPGTRGPAVLDAVDVHARRQAARGGERVFVPPGPGEVIVHQAPHAPADRIEEGDPHRARGGQRDLEPPGDMSRARDHARVQAQGELRLAVQSDREAIEV